MYLSTMGYTSLSTQTRSLVMLGDFLSFVGLGNLSSEISDTLPETNSSHLQHWGCSDEFPCGKAYFAGVMLVLRSVYLQTYWLLLTLTIPTLCSSFQ